VWPSANASSAREEISPLAARRHRVLGSNFPLVRLNAVADTPRMTALRKVRLRVSLVAVLALLLHSLMPLLTPARATAGASPSDWIEVCTAGQLRLIPAAALNADTATPDTGTGNTAKTSLDDCAFCSHHSSAAVRSESGRESPVVPLPDLPPILAFDVLDRHLIWAAEHTRSPPSLN
jgi:hypothetical protein